VGSGRILRRSANARHQGMLNYDLFKKGDPGSIFINVARAEISPIEDLKRLLDERILGGLGMDVYPDEGELAACLRAEIPVTTPTGKIVLELAKRNEVIFTPHNAFNTAEALAKKAQFSVSSITSYLNNGTFTHSVPSGGHS